MSTTDRIAVLQAIDAFCDMANDHPRTPAGYRFAPDAPGKRFTRIVESRNGTGRSVHCFIDNLTGDVYKAAGWKAPAKHVRGNIVTDFAAIAARFDWAGGYLYLK